MDIDLGSEMDGIEAANIILSEKDVPLIFTSSHTDMETIQKTEAVTCYGYIFKNSAPIILNTTIKMALKLFDAKQKARETEIILKQSEAHYRFLFEHGNDAILIVDSKSKFIDANPAACSLLGYTREELLNLSIPDTQLPEDLVEQRLRLDEMRMKGKAINIRRFRRKDGSIFLGETNALLRPDNLIQATIRDITEQRNKEELIEKFNKRIQKAHVELLQRQFAIDEHAIVAITDTRGTILYVNEKFCEISQYSGEELLGNNHRIINSGFHPKIFFNEMYATLKEGLAWHGEIKNRAKDGSYYWVATTIAPIKNAEGKVEQYFAIRTDITNRKKAEEELELHQLELEAQYKELEATSIELNGIKARYLDLYDLAPVGYFSTNEQGEIVEANLTLATSLGIERNRILLQPIFPFICYQDLDNFNFLRQELQRSKKPQSCELRMKRVDGSEFWVRFDAMPFGTIITRIAVTNISRRKEAEKELHHYMKDLENLNRTKDKFFNIIAHDLRNPFAGIIGIADLLEEKLLTKKEENYSTLLQYAKLIQTSSKSAFTLLENLLLWARSQTGEINISLRNLNLHALISFTIPIVSGNAFNKSITIESDLSGPPIVYADEFCLSTILRNLLTNAIKFTHPNGKVIVTSRELEDSIEISITDTGIGMNSKIVESLFRIDSKSSRLGTNNETGTGLGLILCKEFVEKQGGTIKATSQVGIGSTFTLLCRRLALRNHKVFSLEKSFACISKLLYSKK
jgi:PAS domain S-box-containing protein